VKVDADHRPQPAERAPDVQRDPPGSAWYLHGTAHPAARCAGASPRTAPYRRRPLRHIRADRDGPGTAAGAGCHGPVGRTLAGDRAGTPRAGVRALGNDEAGGPRQDPRRYDGCQVRTARSPGWFRSSPFAAYVPSVPQTR
jgi:hypothetical protein